jgi:hypothetical protein
MEPHSEDAQMEPCRICGGVLRPVFKGTVLGSVPVQYALCRQCDSLLLPSPTWLEEAYARKIVPDPDFGALTRTFFIHRCLRRRRSRNIRFLPKWSRTLDIGTGRGLLLRMMLDDHHDAWGFDPYPHSVFAEDRIRTTFPDGPFALITAIKHTQDPVGFLKSLPSRLAPGGFLMLSTELYDSSIHGEDWTYLAQMHGQHITLFSRAGLRQAAQAAGFEWVHSLNWGSVPSVPFAHPFVPSGTQTSFLHLWLLKLRYGLGEWRHKLDSLA